MEHLKKSESIKITGHIKLTLIDPNGKIKQEYENHNLVVNVGKAYLTAFLAANPATGQFASWAGVGTGTAIPAIGDTDLQIPLSTRVQGITTSAGSIWNNNIIFPATIDTGILTEAGLFNTSTGGILFARQVFPPFNKGSLDTFVINWTVTFA